MSVIAAGERRDLVGARCHGGPAAHASGQILSLTSLPRISGVAAKLRPPLRRDSGPANVLDPDRVESAHARYDADATSDNAGSSIPLPP